MLQLPYYLGSTSVSDGASLDVLNKHTGDIAARVAVADADAISRAIGKAVDASTPLRRMPAFKRKAALAHVVQRLTERHAELSRLLTIETGKPISVSRSEVDRSIDTFGQAMEECTRLIGEHMPLDISPRARGCEAILKRVPIGPCSFIIPSNYPLNLAAHKMAPAIAAGCPFVLKPDPKAPICALLLGEMLAETDLPDGAFSVLPALEDGLDLFSKDPRLRLLSFTGSPAVGWMLKEQAGRKKVLLELGGNAACIVDKDAELERAADRLIAGSFTQSGQSCISVQRILAHRSLCNQLTTMLVERIGSLKSGDPLDEETNLGPMISICEAERVEQWVAEAVAQGARALTGGSRHGVFYEPTLLAEAPHDAAVSCREIFGPVATIEPFDDFEKALDIVNSSEFGLQAGIFTNSMDAAFRAFNELEVGAVVINDVPSLRIDSMPYGGVKASGIGREGVRFAMREMTEMRLMVLSDVGR